MPLIPVLAEMGAHGIGFRTDAAWETSTQIQTHVATLEKEAHDMVGRDFSLTSPQDVAWVLYDYLKLKVRW